MQNQRPCPFISSKGSLERISLGKRVRLGQTHFKFMIEFRVVGKATGRHCGSQREKIQVTPVGTSLSISEQFGDE